MPEPEDAAPEVSTPSAIDAAFEASFDKHEPADAAPSGPMTREQEAEQLLASLNEPASHTEKATGDDSDLDEALAAIRRIPGVPEGATKGMSRDAILEWGRSAKDARGQQDDLHRQLAEIRELLAQPKGGEDSDAGTPPTSVDPSTDLRSSLQPLLDELPGEDAAEALIAGLEALTKPLTQRIAELEAGLHTTRATTEASALAATRAELAKPYPQTTDPNVMSSLVADARKVMAAGLAPDLASAIKREARARWGEGVRTEPTHDDELKRRKNGTPHPVGRNRITQGRDMSEDQKLLSIIDRVSRQHGDNGD